MTTQNPANEDGVKTPPVNNEGKDDKTPSPSGQDDKKTPSGEDDKKQEQMVPMSRFREVIDEKNKYKDEIDKRDQAEEKRKRKELEEQGKYKEILAEKDKELESAGKTKEQLTQYEETVQEVLAQELEKIPEDKKTLIPDELSTVAKLKYIAKNRALLMGEKSTTGAPIPPNSKNLSEVEAKKQRYDELMQKRQKGEFLSEPERREIMKLGQEIVALKNQTT
ncbi:hypothetical protein HYV73_00735 [Candidatus Uhrbacteria bacterium]|nr:hypothetical protein [Candidatus Uhrbacteria bacterium]